MFSGDFICLAQAKAHLAHSLSKYLLSIIFVLGVASIGVGSWSCVEQRGSPGEGLRIQVHQAFIEAAMPESGHEK